MRTNLLLLVLAGILAGCSSTPTRVESDVVTGKTFNFVASPPQAYPGAVDRREEIHKMVQGAITQNLAKRGVSQVPTGGDLTVAYLIITGDNVSTSTINTYFGYGRDAQELHAKAQDAYTGTKNPNHFGAGTLVIDLIDSKTYKLLKRNYGSRPLLRDIPPETRAARIQEVVDEILADLQIKG